MLFNKCFLKNYNAKQYLGVVADTCDLSVKAEARVSLEVERKHETVSRWGSQAVNNNLCALTQCVKIMLKRLDNKTRNQLSQLVNMSVESCR